MRQNIYGKLGYCYQLVLLGASIGVIGSTLLRTKSCLAQLIPDGTLGNESSVITPNVNINNIESDRIDGGAIRGANLFHSFSEFNVGEGRGVYFDNPTAIERILTRVTGSNLSEILGTLGVLGKADLFLVNPNGIVFGPGAKLDLNGSFIGSTARGIRFGNNYEFSTVNPEAPPLLTINVPLGLQYGPSPGSIVNQSVVEATREIQISSDLREIADIDETFGLQIRPQQTIALIGGDVFFEGGQATTISGRIELGTVGDNSLVSLSPIDQGWELGYEGVSSFGDISLSKKAEVAVIELEDSPPNHASQSSSSEILVQTRRLRATDGSVIFASTFGPRNVGNVIVKARESVELIGRAISSDETSSPSGLFAQTFSAGNVGMLRVETGRVSIREGAAISGTTFAGGRGGEVSITASESVEMIGVNSITGTNNVIGSSAGEGSTGDGGNVQISTRQLIIQGGGSIRATTFEGGNAGNVQISTRQLIIQGGGSIQSGSSGNGNGGDVTINSSKLIKLDSAVSEATQEFARSFISSSSTGNGNAGDVAITTGELIVKNGANIFSSTFFGSGRGGDITVNASKLVELSDAIDDTRSGLFASAIAGTGEGGNVTVTTDKLIVRDGAIISVSNFQSRNLLPPGSGVPGNIQITADSIQLRREGNLTTNATTTTGGNILIDADTLVALENSDITANAETGTGGRVTIQAQGIFGTQFQEQLTDNSDITATSELGPQFDGIVEINTPDIDASAGLVELSQTAIDVEGLIATDFCEKVRTGESSFAITGRGGLPASPLDMPTHSIVRVDWIEPVQNLGSVGSRRARRRSEPDHGARPREIVEATGWYQTADGTVVLTADPPTAMSSRPGLIHPGCAKKPDRR